MVCLCCLLQTTEPEAKVRIVKKGADFVNEYVLSFSKVDVWILALCLSTLHNVIHLH